MDEDGEGVMVDKDGLERERGDDEEDENGEAGGVVSGFRGLFGRVRGERRLELRRGVY